MEEYPTPPLWYEGRFHEAPAIVHSGGPEWLVTDDPPPKWKPTPVLGFGATPRKPKKDRKK
jgi:hypothetical protein